MPKPRLFVHAQCVSSPKLATTEAIREWLLRKFSNLPLTLDATFAKAKSSEEENDFPTNVEVIHINELQPNSTDPAINVSEVVLEIRTYCFHDTEISDTPRIDEIGEDAVFAEEESQVSSLFTTTSLPCRLLRDSWSQLVFEPPLHESTFFTLGRLGRFSISQHLSFPLLTFK